MYRQNKAIEVLLYIAEKGCVNTGNALKVIYFADKKHIVGTTSTIYGDTYIAMRNGAMPQGAYSIIESIENGSFVCEGMKIHNHTIIPNRPPDMMKFSPLDRKCLDEAIEDYGNMYFSRMNKIATKESDWLSTPENEIISFEKIVASVDKDGEIQAYINSVKGISDYEGTGE